MTLQQILTSGHDQFQAAKLYFGHGTDNAWDEAVWIALHVLKLPLDIDDSCLLRELTEQEEKAIKALYKRRIKERIPVAYLLQEAWFAGLSFYVDERVLIPRSPTAELIQKRFEPYLKTKNPEAILDLCTGSACMAIACAKAFPQAQIDAADISQDALDVAHINIQKHGLDVQVHLHQSDLFTGLDVNKKYDVIISNPPYVDFSDMRALPEEYRREPSLALAAGKDGLSLIDIILRKAKDYLKPSGILIVEVGNSHVALRKKYPKLPFKWVQFSQGEGEVFVLSYKTLITYLRDIN
jgi:ribosomal protein L3 glutamine methyltransferase